MTREKVLFIKHFQCHHLFRYKHIKRLFYLIINFISTFANNIINIYIYLYFFYVYFQSKIALLHDAVNSGRLEELQSLLDEEPDKKKRLVMAKDEAGTGLLHKAVYYDLTDIAKYLIDNYPQIVSTTDAVSTY